MGVRVYTYVQVYGNGCMYVSVCVYGFIVYGCMGVVYACVSVLVCECMRV